MARTASPRLAWAAEVAAPRPDDRVLEVGCGHGVLLGLLAERTTTGLLVGLDRSPAMTTAAAARNRAAVRSGRLELRTAALLDADLGDQPFDLVVAVHVGAFWRPPAHEYGAVRRVLAPTGRLLLVTQPLRPADAAATADRVEALAAPSGLTVHAVHRADTPPRPSIAVELVPGPARDGRVTPATEVAVADRPDQAEHRRQRRSRDVPTGRRVHDREKAPPP